MESIRPLPIPTPISEPFWKGLADHQVTLQQCNDCASWVFYPRSHCNGCLSPNLTWKEVTGNGTIYSFTVTRRPTAPQFTDDIPQLIVVVELNEGVRLNSVMINVAPEALIIGMAVKPVFHLQDSAMLLYFEPA
ncbi:MAG: OB-fold domain-containing protein [Pseudomonadales bacterium]